MIFCMNTSLNITMSAELICRLGRIHLNIDQLKKMARLYASQFLADSTTSIVELLKSYLSILQDIQRMSALISKCRLKPTTSKESKSQKVLIFSFQRTKIQKSKAGFKIFSCRLVFAQDNRVLVGSNHQQHDNKRKCYCCIFFHSD